MLVCLFFILFQMNLFGQEDKVETITWSAEKLTWEDYKADPEPKNTREAASTSSGISYSWSYSTVNYIPDLSYVITTNFYPKSSWVKPDEKSVSLLAHEQLHFDITELHARKLFKAFEAYVEMRNIRVDLQRIYSKIKSKHKKMQAHYDQDTNHGLDKVAQGKWREKIDAALKKLQEYKEHS